MLDDGHRLAAGESDGGLVAHRDRRAVELEALVAQRHARAPGEQAVAAVALAGELPELDHAAFFTPTSVTSWLAGRALMRRSLSSVRSRAALRYAWSRPDRYCAGQYWPACWYQADACSVK